MYLFDLGYLLVIPALLFTFYAQSQVKGAYARYSRVQSSRRVTGAEVARQLLDREGLHNVRVEITRGQLTDHYDPRTRVVRLSPDVYRNSSLAALGIAAHETGHAIQHAKKYFPLAIRNTVVPAANLGSRMALPLFFMGFLFNQGGLGFLMDLGIYLFLLAVIFQAVTLPVEFNASGRAIALLREEGFLYNEELDGARQVLKAAALTYVAALAVALAQLLRLLLLRGRD
ncbi:MAG: zinc metallopeptidase [Firmicutes bacterium]|nr:zinc metallopeptidase [Bacillota bacterium]